MTADHEPLDTQVAIGNDERRMHVRAYNYWARCCAAATFPRSRTSTGATCRDFADHSLLLDFTASTDNPVTSFIGAALRAECEIGDEVRTIADVPPRSLLSRLTDHWLQIIANRAPIGFEAEFTNQRGDDICYRGILMPFSSDGRRSTSSTASSTGRTGRGAAQPSCRWCRTRTCSTSTEPLEPERRTTSWARARR
jgi:hypothetical protein